MKQVQEIKEYVKKHADDFASMIMYFLHDDDYDEYNERLADHRTDTLCWVGQKDDLLAQIAKSGIEHAVEQAVQKFRQDHEKVIVEMLDLKSDQTIPHAIAMIEQYIRDTYVRYHTDEARPQ
ncbi:hypothetical protein [Pedobacter sp. MR2016-24]|uniref:hypothetical protein n=1 Tax=Pedobacter sp. MR2016-24 TaxID=2994466 RepID=UPI002247236D|nr:hypothetical protein [Pedobacter sp. MR2016-24]MCX2483364.1 hypothetical protein [Pedobacter sp. MR2016-24]